MVYKGYTIYNDSQVTQEWVEEKIDENGKGVFFAIHGETTFSNLLAEYNKGKVIICKYDPETPGEQTEWYFTLVRFNTETFDFVGVMKDGTIYRTGLNVNDGWENVTTFIPEEIFIGTYNVTSYADILAAYNLNKFILIKYDIPNTNYTIFVPLTFKGNTPFYFDLIDRRVTNQKIQMSIDTSNIWDFSVSNIVTVDVALDPTSHNPVENMAIAAELTAINNKITGDLNDIFLALASKGVTVPAGAGLDDVAGLIDDVETGITPEYLPTGYTPLESIYFPPDAYGFRISLDFTIGNRQNFDTNEIEFILKIKIPSLDDMVQPVLGFTYNNSTIGIVKFRSVAGEFGISGTNEAGNGNLELARIPNVGNYINRIITISLNKDKFYFDGIPINIGFNTLPIDKVIIGSPTGDPTQVMYVYSCEVRYSGNLIYYGLPAKRNLDDVQSFYDMVLNLFNT